MRVLDLGLKDFKETWELQKNLLKKRILDEIPDTLIVVQHPPVITAGRKTPVILKSQAHFHRQMSAQSFILPHVILRDDVPKDLSLLPPVYHIERGGEATYHGPDQLTFYPIYKLKKRDIHAYLRSLEEVVIAGLKEWGVAGERREGYTGVWCRGKKVASIGIAVERWVCYHGVSVNLQKSDYFKWIRPCGLDPEMMGAVEDFVREPIGLEKAKNVFANSFVRILGEG